MGKKNHIIRYCSTIVITVLIGMIIYSITFLIPSKLLKKNVEESYSLLEEEGEYPHFIYDSEQDSRGMVMNTVPYFFDNYSDSMLINMAYYEGKGNIFQKAMHNEYVVDLKATDNVNLAGLKQALYGDHNTVNSYGRYSLSIVGVLKILLIFLNLGEIRFLLFITGLFFFIYTLYLLLMRVGKVSAATFAISYVLCGGIINNMCLAFSTDFILMFATMILILRKKSINHLREIYLFEIVGILTFFLNFWSMPLLTLGMPLICMILCNMKEKVEYKDILKDIFINSISWIVGLASSVFIKQVINHCLFSDNSGMGQIAYWGGKNDVTILDRIILVAICVGRLLVGKMVAIFCICIVGVFVYIKPIFIPIPFLFMPSLN